MILYHGSNIDIEVPDLSKSRPYKDFGQGFYLSPDKYQAERMAQQRTLIAQKGRPTVSCFEFDESWLYSNELRVKQFDSYSEDWAQFVLMNRDTTIPQPSHNYDIVFGPIADDGVTFQLRRYKAGAITLNELVNELQYSQGITFQYFFGTEDAIAKLKKL